MRIQELNITDMPALAKLYQQFWNEDSNVKKMQDKLASLQHSDSYILLGAFEHDRLIGSMLGIVCEELYGECEPFLVVEDMIVDNAARRKGVGKQLFAELESRAKHKGCAQVILVTETNRTDACRFYESVGFDPTAHKGYKKKL